MSEDKIMKREKEIDDDQIMALFDESNAPYMTASELADEVGMSRQGMHKRLIDLAEAGRLKRKKSGRTVGWWPA